MASVSIRGNTPKLSFSGNAIYYFSWGQVSATETEIRFITADNISQAFNPDVFGGTNGIDVVDNWADNDLLTPPVNDINSGGGSGGASIENQEIQINLATILNDIVATSENQEGLMLGDYKRETTQERILKELQKQTKLLNKILS